LTQKSSFINETKAKTIFEGFETYHTDHHCAI